MAQTIKIFLASSSELQDDRRDFELFIGRKNKNWDAKGVFLKLFMWEDFFDAVSKTRLQDEYNKAVRECDVFVMLFFTRVGQYTEEEFEAAFGQFKATSKPFIFTYFREGGAPAGTEEASVSAFKDKLGQLGHFYTRYRNSDRLALHFSEQLLIRLFLRDVTGQIFQPPGEQRAPEPHQHRPEQVVPRGDIKSMKSAGLSMMPEGLEEGMDKQAVADLLEFIEKGK